MIGQLHNPEYKNNPENFQPWVNLNVPIMTSQQQWSCQDGQLT